MPKPTVPCSRPWCEQAPHEEGTVHFAVIADFTKNATDVTISIAEHERTGGPIVVVSLYLAGEEGGLDLELYPGKAHAVAQVIAALDPAVVLQFAERLAFAAVTLSPDIASGDGGA